MENYQNQYFMSPYLPCQILKNTTPTAAAVLALCVYCTGTGGYSSASLDVYCYKHPQGLHTNTEHVYVYVRAL